MRGPQRHARRVLAIALLLVSAASAAAEWVPVKDKSLEIREGSALDFSHLSPRDTAGAQGRIVASPSGRLAFESDPATPARLNCASLAWSPASGSFPDKGTADRYAAQLRIHGYNLVRFHEVDAILMTGRERDFDFDPEQLDRLHYLLAALKREGIYWMFDVMASQNGAVGGVPERWTDRNRLKLKVHVDPTARSHWRRLATEILGKPNPYTGIAPLHDPALALLVLVNENGLQFLAFLDKQHTGQAYPDLIRPGFNKWLREQYGDTATLRRAWSMTLTGESLEAGTIGLPSRWGERGPRMRDLKRFFRVLEADTYAFMEREVRALGYRGLVTMYNNWLSSETHFARALMPAVALNTYFDEVLSYDPGASIKQQSSLDDNLHYIRSLAGARWLGKPFVVTEYNHLFWNRFRYEAGLVFPAYAALQGWDAICRHGHGAIDLTFDQPWPHKRAILPYGVGLDPIQRAGETLSALLFHRRDVAQARSTVAVPFGRDSDMTEDGLGMMPDEATIASLVTRIGLAPHSTTQGSDANRPQPSLADQRLTAGVLNQIAWSRPDTIAAAIERLRASGVLSGDNRTDANARRFESDTGEILIDAGRRFARVKTERTEAASFEKLDGPERLGAVTLAGSTGPALISVSALDDQPIAKSERLLIIVATDAMNTDMKFRDRQRRTIASYGRMPVLLKRETVRLSIAFDDARSATLRALHLDGTPGDQIPVEQARGRIDATIDNAAFSHGPTTFFLLERKPPGARVP